MKILSVHEEIEEYLNKRGLEKKFAKQVRFLEADPKYPSLNVELMEPKGKGVYSFRVDGKYKALFIFRDDLGGIDILAVTDHYQ